LKRIFNIKLIIVFFVYLLNCTLFSQNKNTPIISKLFTFPTKKIANISETELGLIKSSHQKFNQANSDTSKIKIVSDLIDNSYDDRVWNYYNNYLLAIIELKLQGNLDKKSHQFYQIYYGNCILNKGFWYGEKGNIILQKKFYKHALTIFQKINYSVGLGSAYNNLGYIYDNQGNIPLALKYYLKSLKIKEQIKDSSGIAISYLNIGFNYDKLEDYKQALIFLKKSLEIQKKLGDNYGIANSYNHIAATYQKYSQKLNDESLLNYSFDLYQKALKIHLKLENKSGIAESYNNIGSFYHLQNKLNEALTYYRKSYALQKEIADNKGFALSAVNIGAIYYLKKELNEAEKFGLEALKIAIKLGFPSELNDASKLLYDVNKKKNNIANALKYYELHIKMRDSLSNIENTRKNIQLNMQYSYDKQKNADSIKNIEAKKLNELKIIAQNSEIKHKKTQNFALFGGLIVVFVFLVIIFNRFKASQTQNKIIQEQKKLVVHQKMIVEEQHKEITDSIKYAERIQGAILPPEQKWQQILPNSFVLNKPKDILSGDFYWIVETESYVFIAAADCTGHGVPGALISIVNFNLLNKAVLERGLILPSDILDAVNTWLTESLNQTVEESSIKDGMDIALISINRTNGEVLFSGANNPLYLFSNNELIEYKADKHPVGAFIDENIQHFTTKEIPTKFGDTIYLFSDGYADQFGGTNGKKYKYKQLKEQLFMAKDLPIFKQKEYLNNEFKIWKGMFEQTDDVLIIGINFV
jgi:serine phosphatase RsbU (regulator of sigma subunit)